MAFGVTPEGFKAKTLEEIKADIEAALLAEISPNLNLSSQGVLGQLVGIFASKTRENWELAQSVWASNSVLTASGFSLDLVTVNTGTVRRDASRSLVDIEFTLAAGSVEIPAGSRFQVPGDNTAIFETQTTVPPQVVAGTVTVQAQSQTFGPVAANANTITQSLTAFAGLTSLTNPEDAVPGQVKESDAALRERQQDEVFGVGSGPKAAIRAALLAIQGVEQVSVFENTLGITVGGVPPHSIEVVVFDGTVPAVPDNTLAQAIWDNKCAGINEFGTSSGTATDDESNTHTVGFSRPTVVDVYLEFDVQVNTADFPSNGATLIQEAVASYGDNNLEVGDDVIISALCTAVFSVAGVVDVVATRVGETVSPGGTDNLVVDPRELADLDTGRIVVNIV